MPFCLHTTADVIQHWHFQAFCCAVHKKIKRYMTVLFLPLNLPWIFTNKFTVVRNGYGRHSHSMVNLTVNCLFIALQQTHKNSHISVSLNTLNTERLSVSWQAGGYSDDSSEKNGVGKIVNCGVWCGWMELKWNERNYSISYISIHVWIWICIQWKPHHRWCEYVDLFLWLLLCYE